MDSIEMYMITLVFYIGNKVAWLWLLQKSIHWAYYYTALTISVIRLDIKQFSVQLQNFVICSS